MPRKEREERLARAGQKITLAIARPSVLHSANTHAEVLENVFQVYRSENMCEPGHEQKRAIRGGRKGSYIPVVKR